MTARGKEGAAYRKVASKSNWVTQLTKRYGITRDQARKLIKKVGSDPEKLTRAAEKFRPVSR
jgi:hypothetical protein